jgi:hypothetical protein
MRAAEWLAMISAYDDVGKGLGLHGWAGGIRDESTGYRGRIAFALVSAE